MCTCLLSPSAPPLSPSSSSSHIQVPSYRIISIFGGFTFLKTFSNSSLLDLFIVCFSAMAVSLPYDTVRVSYRVCDGLQRCCETRAVLWRQTKILFLCNAQQAYNVNHSTSQTIDIIDYVVYNIYGQTNTHTCTTRADTPPNLFPTNKFNAFFAFLPFLMGYVLAIDSIVSL